MFQDAIVSSFVSPQTELRSLISIPEDMVSDNDNIQDDENFYEDDDNDSVYSVGEVSIISEDDASTCRLVMDALLPGMKYQLILPKVTEKETLDIISG